MDIADKHRELVIISTTGLIEGLDANLARAFRRHVSGTIKPFSPELKRQFDQHSKIARSPRKYRSGILVGG